MAFVTWFSVAAANDPNGEVTIASTNSEDPMLYGNLMALGCGGVIALGGSLAFPDTEFRWEMLGRIPMIVSRTNIAGIWVAFFSRCQRYSCGQGW